MPDKQKTLGLILWNLWIFTKVKTIEIRRKILV